VPGRTLLIKPDARGECFQERVCWQPLRSPEPPQISECPEKSGRRTDCFIVYQQFDALRCSINRGKEKDPTVPTPGRPAQRKMSAIALSRERDRAPAMRLDARTVPVGSGTPERYNQRGCSVHSATSTPGMTAAGLGAGEHTLLDRPSGFGCNRW